MPQSIRKLTVVLYLIGVLLGLGGILIVATDVRTSSENEHVDENWVCVDGCNLDDDICCRDE